MYSLRKKIINFARRIRIKEGPDPLFYKNPQKYFVNFETRIKNLSKLSSSLFLVMPVPKNTEYQKLLVEPKFFPGNPIINTDKIFGNKYAYWDLNFAPHEEKNFQEEFIIAISPRKNPIISRLVLNENLMRRRLINLINCFINPEDKKIQEIIKRIAGNEKKADIIIKQFNNYVVSHVSYGNPIKGLYYSTDALEKSKVDCGGFDTLLAALCLARRIPARIISGFFAGYKKNPMHAWLEIEMSDGTWIPADPSIEHLRNLGKTKKTGELGFVGSDRIALSIGSEIPINIGDKFLCVDILQNPIIISDNNKTFKIETKFETKFL